MKINLRMEDANERQDVGGEDVQKEELKQKDTWHRNLRRGIGGWNTRRG